MLTKSRQRLSRGVNTLTAQQKAVIAVVSIGVLALISAVAWMLTIPAPRDFSLEYFHPTAYNDHHGAAEAYLSELRDQTDAVCASADITCEQAFVNDFVTIYQYSSIDAARDSATMIGSDAYRCDLFVVHFTDSPADATLRRDVEKVVHDTRLLDPGKIPVSWRLDFWNIDPHACDPR